MPQGAGAPPAPRGEPRPRRETPDPRAQIAAEFDRLGIDDQEERVSYVMGLARIDDSRAITDDILGPVLASLKQCTHVGDIQGFFTADGEAPSE